MSVSVFGQIAQDLIRIHGEMHGILHFGVDAYMFVFMPGRLSPHSARYRRRYEGNCAD
jgi:hypothetical protein